MSSELFNVIKIHYQEQLHLNLHKKKMTSASKEFSHVAYLVLQLETMTWAVHQSIFWFQLGFLLYLLIPYLPYINDLQVM